MFVCFFSFNPQHIQCRSSRFCLENIWRVSPSHPFPHPSLHPALNKRPLLVQGRPACFSTGQLCPLLSLRWISITRSRMTRPHPPPPPRATWLCCCCQTQHCLKVGSFLCILTWFTLFGSLGNALLRREKLGSVSLTFPASPGCAFLTARGALLCSFFLVGVSSVLQRDALHRAGMSCLHPVLQQPVGASHVPECRGDQGEQPLQLIHESHRGPSN